jgi:hypothetical protein
MKYQDEALGLKHYMIEVKEPFKQSYRSAILSLKKRHGINTVITGDISVVVMPHTTRTHIKKFAEDLRAVMQSVADS